MATELQILKAQKQLVKEKQRLTKAEISKSKQEVSQDKYKKTQDKNKSKSFNKVLSSLNQKVTSRDILKKQKQITINIPESKVENIFEDENRFFKGNFEKEKRSMFLS